jgi:hypothetical protein
MGIGNRAARRRIGIATASGLAVTAVVVAMAGTAGAATAGAAAGATPRVADAPPSDGYQFVTMGSTHDKTFNQLLGINNEGVIAGYFGSGAKGHPNKGYVIEPPYEQKEIVSQNFPGSVQTQVTGLNDHGVTVGFFSTMNTASLANNNFGWYRLNGHFHEVNFSTGTPSAPPVDQLLGVNNHDVAVGFFANAGGLFRGYTYNINTKSFNRVTVPGAKGLGPSLQATGINNSGAVVGAYVPNAKAPTVTDGFLKLSASGPFIKLAVPGATSTVALGVNDADWVVGDYVSGGATHGFIYRLGHGFTTNVDDPNGIGTTVLNGINDENDLVGFYTNPSGSITFGMVGFPAF